MEHIFERLFKTNFSELTGLTVDASIPVPERLANELIASQLQGNQSITYCRVSVEPQNRLDVHLKTPLWPWPLNLKLRLFGAIDLAGSATLRAFLENHVLLARLGSLLKALPAEIKIYNDQLSIDLGSFIKDPAQKRFLELVREVEIKTDVGKIILNIKIEA